MSQIEDAGHLAVLPDATTRALIIVITEIGLRANDACSLPFNPMIDESAGWPACAASTPRWPLNNSCR
jgi:hypothetical protein